MQTTGRRALGGIGGIAFVLTLVLGGCAMGSGDTADQASGEGGSAAPADRPNGLAAPGPAQRQGGQGGGGPEPASRPRIVPEDRAIIYTSNLRVRARDVQAAASRAEQIVSAAGGYVQGETTATDPDAREGARATVTFKIPAEEYERVLDELGSRLGTRLHLEQRAQDVTEEVADVDARMRSAEASLDRMRRLLAEAETIGEVLSVEQEIASRQAELESLQARQRALANQTQYATVTLELVSPAARDEPDVGFLAGLAGGWRAFTAALNWSLTALGALLPFLVALGIVGVGGWRGAALLRRRRATPSP